MISVRNYSKKSIALVGAFGLALTAILPLLSGIAGAAQVTARSIELSNATPSATSITYNTTFNIATAGNTGGVVVQFCNSAIIGTACTAPTGLNATSYAVSVGTIGTNVYTATTTADPAANTIAVQDTTPSSQSAAAAATLTFTGITNPSAVGTFYARIYTFATGAEAAAFTAASPGTYIDYGGVALTTVDAYTVTTTVQEYIDFTVGSTAVNIGVAPNYIMLPNTPYIANQTYTTTTNASQGETVRLYSPAANGSGTLKSGSNTFSNSATAAALNASSNQFGLCIGTQTATVGTLTAAAPYAVAGSCSTSSNFALDTTAVAATYGDTILSSTGPVVAAVANNLTYGAEVGEAQASGLYTTTHNLIATGVF
jgi:hypothetical protein